MRFPKLILLLGLAGIIAVPAIANASGQGTASRWQAVTVAQQNGPSLSEAVEQVRRQYRGRIVSAQTRLRGNREVHIIKVLTDDGKVKTVRVPGRTRSNQGRG